MSLGCELGPGMPYLSSSSGTKGKMLHDRFKQGRRDKKLIVTTQAHFKPQFALVMSAMTTGQVSQWPSPKPKGKENIFHQPPGHGRVWIYNCSMLQESKEP